MKKRIRTHKSGVPARMSPSASAAPSDSRKNNFDLDKLLISLDGHGGSILWRAAEFFACLLTVLLPIKFASFVSAPEGGALYWSDPLSLVFIAWPLPIFMMAAPVLLAVTVCSAVFSVLAAGLGILIAIMFGTPVGSTIVGTDIVGFLIFFLIGTFAKRRA